jgi:hypothetical protein
MIEWSHSLYWCKFKWSDGLMVDGLPSSMMRTISSGLIASSLFGIRRGHSSSTTSLIRFLASSTCPRVQRPGSMGFKSMSLRLGFRARKYGLRVRYLRLEIGILDLGRCGLPLWRAQAHLLYPRHPPGIWPGNSRQNRDSSNRDRCVCTADSG